MEPSGDVGKGAGHQNAFRVPNLWCSGRLLLEHPGHSGNFSDLHAAPASAGRSGNHDDPAFVQMWRVALLDIGGSLQYRSICVWRMSDGGL